MSTVLEFQKAPGKPVLRGIAHYWAVIREIDQAGSSWSVHDIDQKSNAGDRATISDYVRRLVAAGIAAPTGEIDRVSGGKRVYYHLIRRPRAAPRLRRDGTATKHGRGGQQVWNVLRGPEGRGGLTVADIAMRASTDEVVVTHQTAQAYIKHLATVGIVLPVKRGVWKLAPRADTGPTAPKILRTQVVYDCNRGEAMAPIAAEEDRS